MLNNLLDYIKAFHLHSNYCEVLDDYVQIWHLLLSQYERKSFRQDILTFLSVNAFYLFFLLTLQQKEKQESYLG